MGRLAPHTPVSCPEFYPLAPPPPIHRPRTNLIININKIETAPTQIIKQDRPIKIKPNVIKYEATPKNKPIYDINETMGILLKITTADHNNHTNKYIY